MTHIDAILKSHIFGLSAKNWIHFVIQYVNKFAYRFLVHLVLLFFSKNLWRCVLKRLLSLTDIISSNACLLSEFFALCYQLRDFIQHNMHFLVVYQKCMARHTAKTKCQKFETNIPRNGISGPQSQFPHSCVCERIIYSHDGSAFSAGGNMWTDHVNI
jgi:hypothetical protein